MKNPAIKATLPVDVSDPEDDIVRKNVHVELQQLQYKRYPRHTVQISLALFKKPGDVAERKHYHIFQVILHDEEVVPALDKNGNLTKNSASAFVREHVSVVKNGVEVASVVPAPDERQPGTPPEMPKPKRKEARTDE